MRPDDRELDDEIRGHLALSIQERIERGEDPAAARRAALDEFGYIPQVRESMRGVWYSRGYDALRSLVQEVRIGLRSVLRARGVAATVVVTLALGIGANAAIFSVVRGVLLRPLVNRGEDRIVYVRQNAPGLGSENIKFSVPEIQDLHDGIRRIGSIGEFSTVDFTMVGLGDPRIVKAGVVSGSYFEVMGLRPVAGRLLTSIDDGPDAKPVAVLTHGFWMTAAKGDDSVVGKTMNLGSRAVMIVGVLEPSIPYPAETEIIANVVTSPHHLAATMTTIRTHRMTDVFIRLADGVTIEQAREALAAAHEDIRRAHPDEYPASANIGLAVTPLRDQIAGPARGILLVLMAAAGVVFIIACLNVTSLILARSVRREVELATRTAVGASRGALRRSLLTESLLLCGAGAALGVLLARPLVSLVAEFAARFSVRALDVTVDASLLWIAVGLAIAAAVVLAYIPRLPSPHQPTGAGRITPTTSRRLRTFATVQVACSFVLLAGAATLLTTLVRLQQAQTGFNLRQVLALDLPAADLVAMTDRDLEFYEDLVRRISALPDVNGVALGNFVPWRDGGTLGPGFPFTAVGYETAPGEEQPRGRIRLVTPGFFGVVGLPMIAGRDFAATDRRDTESVVIVSESVARRLFPTGTAIGRQIVWTDSLFGKKPRRIVGIVTDVDDEHVAPGPALTVYHPIRQMPAAGRLFVHSAGDPYALVPQITQTIREMSTTQAVANPATLRDIRADVMAANRVNAFVVSGFAGVALLIAVVGVMGVLAFSVSARIREFGLRLAMGSTPRLLLMRVLSEGARIVGVGILAGAAAGYVLVIAASSYLGNPDLPGFWPMAGAAFVLVTAGLAASLIPAARAARVDVIQALRTE